MDGWCAQKIKIRWCIVMKITKAEYKEVIKKIDYGLGDTLSRIIKTVTNGKLNECNGCEKRKEFLNKIIPYKMER